MVLYVAIMLVSAFTGWTLTLHDDEKNFPYKLVGGLLCVAVPMILSAIMISSEPRAIDVYRDKTTLEITYRDGVPVDSVVVFKDKEK